MKPTHMSSTESYASQAPRKPVCSVATLQIAVRHSGDVTILDLRGRATINDGESELLGEHLQRLTANGSRKLVLDLTELTQVDSSAISIIVTMFGSLRTAGGDLRLLRPVGHVREMFTILRLMDMIPTFDDEAQALASFRL